jgi:hypothetical protein
MTDQAIDLEPLKRAIVSLVQTHYDSTRRAMLLSRLGQALQKEGFNVGRGRLAGFLHSELAGHIRLIPRPNDPKVLAALPAGLDETAVAASTAPAPLSGEATAPRYVPSFWAAFTKPLAQGATRVVEFDPPRFHDQPSAIVPAGSLTVPREQVFVREATETPADHRLRVQAAVKQWLNTNGVSLELVLDRPRRHQSHSLLDQLIAALSPEQRQRLSLPLDIVERLKDG